MANKVQTVLKGKKTYIIASLMVVVGLVNYLTGDIGFFEFIQSPDVVLILEGLGISTLRAGIAK